MRVARAAATLRGGQATLRDGQARDEEDEAQRGENHRQLETVKTKILKRVEGLDKYFQKLYICTLALHVGDQGRVIWRGLKGNALVKSTISLIVGQCLHIFGQCLRITLRHRPI